MWSQVALAALVGVVSAAPAPAPLPVSDSLVSPYAPVKVACPDRRLNRRAHVISDPEASYLAARQTKTQPALAAWIESVDSSFDTSVLPNLAFAASGGGYRSMLCTAGVIQAFDSRDSNLSTAGIFQSFTYTSALSGGGWFLSSLAGNNWPTISNLQSTVWGPALADSPLDPEGAAFALADAQIVDDITQKSLAGFPPSIVDPYGRLLSYTLLKGDDGGVADTLSGVRKLSNFTTKNVPFPILTSIGVASGECTVIANSTQYEFSPYEFGSWDAGVRAFTKTKYLGTSMSNNTPSTSTCINGYDNLGFVLGTCSDIFGEVCEIVANDTTTFTGVLAEIVDEVEAPVTDDTDAIYPNPFYMSDHSPAVSSQTELHLVDGGISGQNDPIWPFLQPERSVTVLIVSDNSADTSENLPNGSEIYATYQRAVQAGLTKMPVIPPVATFLAEGLNNSATVFGCNDPEQLTIVWIPNVPYSYPSGVSTEMLEYTPAQTAGMISNGNLIGTQNGTAEWPTCLACVMQKKTGTELPSACDACFDRYCWQAN